MSFFDKFWPKWVSRVQYACQVLFNGNAYIGRGDEWPGCPDFLMCFENINTSDDVYMWPSNGKLFTRSLVLGEKGDAVDLVIRKAGPDNSKYNDMTEAPVKDGENIGALYWQTWGGAQGGGNYWTPRNGHEGRLVSIRCRAVGDQTATSRAGRLQIGVTPKGATDPVDRLEITDQGVLRYNFPGKGWRKLTVDSKGFVRAST